MLHHVSIKIKYEIKIVEGIYVFYLFDLINSNLADLKIEENDKKDNCFIKNIKTKKWGGRR